MPEDDSLTVDQVRDIIEDFLHDLSDRPLSAQEIEAVLAGRKDDLDSSDLDMKPERHAEENIIFPLLRACGIEYDPQAFGERGGHTVWPDFKITNIQSPISIGENKPYNNADDATDEIKDYLDRKSIDADYGIITDGLEWRIHKAELGGDTNDFPEITERIELNEAVLQIARDINVLGSSSVSEVDVDEILQEFIDVFDFSNYEHLVSQTAPKILRDERKRDVEAFYDLYMELLFGQGDDYDYDTSLLDDIQSPEGADERDERLFAVTLMNRLLFIKFLESREVVDEGLLRELTSFYEENSERITGTLYSSQIKPLIYDILNSDDQMEKHQRGIFERVPYLNGGLFRANLENEKEYDVVDRTLPDVIVDLIEGSKLELSGEGYDPAIIGSVFEKTITHIEEERSDEDEDEDEDGSGQKDKGAYYTPTDVTELVVGRAIDPKIRDALIDTLVDEVTEDESEEEQVRGYLEQLSLADILLQIEDNDTAVLNPTGATIEIDFGDDEVLDACMDELSELRILDPACGSGHFLTAAMDELYRAILSVYRGRHNGEEPEAERRYELKRDLALNSIYGMDADRIATEIAKLRVWLKIVEDNSWDPSFDKLPNIDVNIRDANALVGLPIQGITTAGLDLATVYDDVEEMLNLREEYKFEDRDDKDEIEQLEEEIRPVLDNALMNQLNDVVKTFPEDNERALAVLNTVDGPLHETVEEVQIKHEDEIPDGSQRALTEDEKEERFNKDGITPYTKSLSIDVQDRERAFRNNGEDGSPKEQFIDEVSGWLDEGWVITRIQRRPMLFDLDEDNMFGQTGHWFAEFPEARPEGDERKPTVAFDVIIGNPPYGDLLSPSEEVVTDTYRMAGKDIVALFLERQLSLLADDGYIGNVASLKITYDDSLGELLDIFRERLDTTQISCFGKRPSCVFEGVEVRIAVLSGQKNDVEYEDEPPENIETSEFLRFDDDIDRDERLRNVTHRSVDGYILRENGIGEDGDYVKLPKMGSERIEGIIQTLKEHGRENIIRNRVAEGDTGHAIWRREGQDYFVNPMMEELYSAREVKPFHFETELEQLAAFLATGSSLFYLYWCVFGDQYHVNLSHIRCFPIPPLEDLREHEEEIRGVADDLWTVMEDGFDPSSEEFDYEPMKPHIDRADAVMGPIYGLSDEEIEFLQNYHTIYGRHGPDDYSLENWSQDSREEDTEEATAE